MDKQYKINEFAKMINVSVKTLQRWDNNEVLKAFRTPTNRRYYTHRQYLEYISASAIAEIKGKHIIYLKVSSYNQEEDLKSKVELLKQYANSEGIILDIVLLEDASIC